MQLRSILIALPTLLTAGGLAEPAAAQTFKAGDLYLNTGTATGICSGCGGLVHVDPISGAANLLLNYFGATGAIAYDPFRDRLLLTISPGGIGGLYSADVLGNTLKLLSDQPRGIAPVGDGRVYLVGGFMNANPFQRDLIRYLDAAGGLHALLDASGSAEFFLSTTSDTLRGLVYDAPTNALYSASAAGSSTMCPGGASDKLNVYRIPLSADGTKVAGALACSQFDVTPAATDENPVGLSRGPGGSLILVVDNNSNAAHPRILRIEPATLAITTFATVGPYTGAAATNAGSYSNVRSAAVILDTLIDQLREFDAGSSGTGFVFGSGPLSGAGGSGETVAMAEIGGASTQYGLSSDLNTISLAAGGTQTLSLDAGPAHAGQLYLVLGSLSGWSPGIPAGSLNLPLNLDAYLLLTLQSPNTPPLAGSLGFLNAQGQATCTVSLPAGSSPSLVGLLAYHAGAALDGALAPTFTSNPVPLGFVP